MEAEDLIKEYENKIELLSSMLKALWNEPGTLDRQKELQNKIAIYSTFIKKLKQLS